MACDKKKLFFMARGKKSLATTGLKDPYIKKDYTNIFIYKIRFHNE
jgi:hypothetical protein